VKSKVSAEREDRKNFSLFEKKSLTARTSRTILVLYSTEQHSIFWLQMDVLRRNTDYALRAMVNLASHHGQKCVPTKELASAENISYQLACKILQKLHKARLVRSSMGAKGGFQLSREPSKINLLDVICAIQGPVRLNRCLLGVHTCPRRPRCPVHSKLAELQKCIDSYLRTVTLDELVRSGSPKREKKLSNFRRGKR